MLIDKESYELPVNNYIQKINRKRLIVIGHTHNSNMRHFNGWLHRYNKKFKRTAAYTIGENGEIFQHFDPRYQSNILNSKLDDVSIVILLENDGYLRLNENIYMNWFGDIYNKDIDNIIERKWRNQSLWAPYSDEQFKSTLELIRMLCYDFSIKKQVIGHNVFIDDLEDYNGILYWSNIDKKVTEVSPAWKCESFKHNLEFKLLENE